MKLTMSTRNIETNESIHVYGNHDEGWEVVLMRSGSANGHLLYPHMFGMKVATLSDCLDYIQHRMDAGRQGWGFNCSCCGHTSDKDIREELA